MQPCGGIAMLNVAICDDENAIVNQIEKCILDLCEAEKISIDTDVFYSGASLEQAYLSEKKYDLIFLDIQMENINGISAAKKIRELDENVLIVFVSGYEKYMRELFQYDVFSFIQKPIDKQNLEHIFLSAHKKICSKNFYFQFKYNGAEFKIPCKEIMYFESIGRKIYINLRNGEQECFNSKLSEVEAELAEGKVPFLRIHQSYLVNYHMIKAWTRSVVILVTGMQLPISEERQKSFALHYGRLLGGEIDV